MLEIFHNMHGVHRDLAVTDIEHGLLGFNVKNLHAHTFFYLSVHVDESCSITHRILLNY